MVLAWSGKMLLWGYSYNAGHLLLAKGDQAAEMLIVRGSYQMLVSSPISRIKLL